jgi:phosphoglycerate kinase
MKTVKDINFEGKKALIRVDFNVPVDKDYNVTDLTRIKAAKPTIAKILADGGSAVLMSHFGRPKGIDAEFSFGNIYKTIGEVLGYDVKFINTCVGAEAEAAVAALKPGEVLLLENLRFHKEETDGDLAFSEQLSKLGDIYVNDAFGTAHRAHASTTIVAQFFDVKVAGFVIEAELVSAERVLNGGVKPVTAIMGGAKVSDKILIIEKLLDVADNIIIGGGMSYTFAKAEGGKIGNSLCQNDLLEYVLELEAKAKAKGVNLIFPTDNFLGDAFSNDANTQISLRGQIPDGWEGFDIGPQSIEKFSKVIKESKTVIWNGPMGVFEIPIEVAKAVKEATENGAFSLIGGGDSAAAINNLGFGDDVSYVSTGGGALLEYMEGKVLPGIAALQA